MLEQRGCAVSQDKDEWGEGERSMEVGDEAGILRSGTEEKLGARRQGSMYLYSAFHFRQ